MRWQDELNKPFLRWFFIFLPYHHQTNGTMAQKNCIHSSTKQPPCHWSANCQAHMVLFFSNLWGQKVSCNWYNLNGHERLASPLTWSKLIFRKIEHRNDEWQKFNNSDLHYILLEHLIRRIKPFCICRIIKFHSNIPTKKASQLNIV